MRTIYLFLIIIFLSTNVLSLGIAPAKINIDEDTQEFKFKIFNNEKLNTTIKLGIKGDDFIQLENNLINLNSDEEEVIVFAKIKNKKYNSSQFANIHLSELRKGDSQINVNLGLSVPITLRVYEEDARLNAQITTPAPDKLGKGPYLISIKNLGLKDVHNATATLKTNNLTANKSFSIKGRESEDLIFNFKEKLTKGFHDVQLNLNYNSKNSSINTTVQSGKPHINITNLKVNDYNNNLLDLNIKLATKWPEQTNNKLYIKTPNQEYESQTFKLNHTDQKDINMIIQAPSNNFTMDMSLNNQKPKSYDVKIIDGKVFINGEYGQKDGDNYLILLIIVLIITTIIFIRKKINMNKNEKLKEQKNKKTNNENKKKVNKIKKKKEKNKK